MIFKTCLKCKAKKELNAFTFDAGYHRNKCKICVNTERRYRLDTNTNSKEKKKARDARYYKKHQEKLHKQNREWALNNIEKFRSYSKKYKLNNKEAVSADSRARRLAKIKRVPKWVDKDQLWLIKEAYEISQLRTKLFGISWHVDHIIPLQGDLVSGLHVIENLQVIPGIENVKKNNRYIIE